MFLLLLFLLVLNINVSSGVWLLQWNKLLSLNRNGMELMVTLACTATPWNVTNGYRSTFTTGRAVCREKSLLRCLCCRDVGETLSNHDGTFQKRAELKMTPDERKKNQFTCVVEHKSGDPIHKILTEKKIRTNSPESDAGSNNSGAPLVTNDADGAVHVSGRMVQFYTRDKDSC